MKEAIFVLVPAYVIYITVLGLRMFSIRYKAVKSGDVKVSYFKDYKEPAPSYLEVMKNHFENQFQLPILFIIACVTIYLGDCASIAAVVFSYLFFASRLVHSYFHLGTNNIMNRANSFFFGVFLLLCLWLTLSFSLLLK